MLFRFIKTSFIVFLAFFSIQIMAFGSPFVTVPSDLTTALYSPNGNEILGNPKGSITITAFFDYNCPYCRQASEVLDNLTKQNNQIRVVLKEIPRFGKSSEPVTLAALAAQNQKRYMDYHNALMAATGDIDQVKALEIAEKTGLNVTQLTTDMSSAKTRSLMNANAKLAKQLKVTGVPVFFITKTDILNNKVEHQIMQVGSANTQDFQDLIAKLK